MTEIKNQSELKKLDAYFRVKAKGRFSFEPELLENVFTELKKCAEEYNVNILLETFDDNKSDVLLFTTSGALIGGVVGYMLAYIPGALVGVIVGATIGAFIGSITVTLRCENEAMLLEIS